MILDGKKIAEKIIIQLQNEVASLRVCGVIPGLGIVLVGEDPASVLYVSIKEREARALGMRCDVVRLSAGATQEELYSVIDTFNGDQALHGIIVQIPIPRTLNLDAARSRINSSKDVDCLHPQSLERLKNGERSLRPPVAESVKQLIETSGVTLDGRNVIVVGGGLFASQITWHCANHGANVMQIREGAVSQQEILQKAEIVISVVGRPHLITADMISEGAIVIDVGVSKSDTGIVGDVDFESVALKARAITPVPGGVGPVTVACLLENVVLAAKRSLT